jgi:hypothetical protein
MLLLFAGWPPLCGTYTKEVFHVHLHKEAISRKILF